MPSDPPWPASWCNPRLRLYPATLGSTGLAILGRLSAVLVAAIALGGLASGLKGRMSGLTGRWSILSKDFGSKDRIKEEMEPGYH
jgi:hypothetical protein